MFRLKIQQVDQRCLVELTWGQGQSLSAQLSYPTAVIQAYGKWLRAYLHFYKTLSLPPVVAPGPQPDLRGHVVKKGGLTPLGVDWQAELVQTEAHLLYQFHQWLHQAELFEIRATIAQAAITQATLAPASTANATSDDPPSSVDLCLVCAPVELARLPWETWEIGAEFGKAGAIRIARCPINVHAVPGKRRSPQQRLRVLAVLGDEQGLDFKADCEALRLLTPLAEVKFVGGNARSSGGELKAQICDAIAEQQGWDLLFFAGHSDETDLTGGELAIAPGVKLSIQEIAPQLVKAKERGLQLAIFNSCSGLSIAEALIDLGLSQVVIMREPIPNRVAQTFLLHFLQHLLAYEDTHDALRSTCQFLKLEQSISLPSAYLVPSLFRHPQTELLQLQPRGIKRWILPWRPAQREAIAIFSLLLFSLWPSSQQFLLEHRIWAQAVFRDLTGQVSTPAEKPPVLLVQIDSESIRRSGMVRPQPMDRTYLAQLVDRLATVNPKIIGIDYLLDRRYPRQDQILAQAVRSTIARQRTWFVFAALENAKREDVGVNPATEIAPPHASLQAHINALPSHVKLLPPGDSCQRSCPFAYLIALVAAYTQEAPPKQQLQPPMAPSLRLKSQLLDHIETLAPPSSQVARIHQLRFHPVTAQASNFGQLWLRPILDFSIPPSQVYERLPAWSLLDQHTSSTRVMARSHAVAIIAPGGYDEAGITQPDYFPLPPAIQYWRMRLPPPTAERAESDGALTDLPRFTGAEAHAYMIHHLLTQRLVVPIPDTWLVLLAAILGKASVLQWGQIVLDRKQRTYLTLGLLGISGLYLLFGLQLYLSAAVLLPWLLPVVMVWFYILPMIGGKGHG